MLNKNIIGFFLILRIHTTHKHTTNFKRVRYLMLVFGGIAWGAPHFTSTFEPLMGDAMQQRAAMIAKHRRQEGDMLPFVRHLMGLGIGEKTDGKLT